MITIYGIEPTTEKVQVIKDFSLPTIACELKRLLRMINFYRENSSKAFFSAENIVYVYYLMYFNGLQIKKSISTK